MICENCTHSGICFIEKDYILDLIKLGVEIKSCKNYEECKSEQRLETYIQVQLREHITAVSSGRNPWLANCQDYKEMWSMVDTPLRD